MQKNRPELAKFIRSLPQTSGVYLMKDRLWRERLQLRKMAVTFKPNGETYDLPEIEEYIASEYVVEGDVVRLSRRKEVTMKRFLSHWPKHTSDDVIGAHCATFVA